MLEIKVEDKNNKKEVNVNMEGNVISLGHDFIRLIETLIKREPRVFTPALFIAINHLFTSEQIQHRLARAEAGEKVASILAPIFEANKHFGKNAPYSEQKSAKNVKTNNKNAQKKPNKPNKPKVTKFDSFEDFIADMEKTIRGE